MTFMKAMLSLKMESESLTDFRQQYAKLTQEDKEWFRKAFEKKGVQIDEPHAPPNAILL